VGQTLLRQLADQGDKSKDRYKLTVFLKVNFREEFSENTLFMHYPENLHRIYGVIPDCTNNMRIPKMGKGERIQFSIFN